MTRGVEVVGDVMYDVLLQARQTLNERAQTLLAQYQRALAAVR